MANTLNLLDPLSLLAMKHGADKWGEHQYTPVYHQQFHLLRNEPLKLLEIGIGGYDAVFSGGASLRMWAEYFPNSQIVGVDIASKRIAVPERVTLLQGSQADSTFLHKVWAEYGPFDIIIDDGSHIADHVLASFSALYPLMQEGTTYVVEDVQTAFWPKFYGGSPDGRDTIISVVQASIVDMHRLEIEAVGGPSPQYSFGDITAGIHVFRNLVFFERGPNVFPSNAAYHCEHPSVELALDILEQQQLASEAPGTFVTEATLLANGGRLHDAVARNAQGLASFPQSIELLYQASQLNERVGNLDVQRAYLHKISSLLNDDPEAAFSLQQFLARIT